MDVDERLLDESGKLCLNKAKLIVYSHGDYLALGRKLGSFGYSVQEEEKNRSKSDACFRAGSQGRDESRPYGSPRGPCQAL